jgi:uncharacterized protein YecT (DUF1311 family)
MKSDRKGVVLAVATIGSLALILGARAEEALPKGWKPEIDYVIEATETELERSTAQQEMNLLTGRLAELKDIKLAIVYLQFYAALTKDERAALKIEQGRWLKKRERVMEEAARVDPSERGSIAPMEENLVYIKTTETRTEELLARHKKLK